MTISTDRAASVTNQRISDLLCSALEGGSNYWYQITETHEPPVYTFNATEGHITKHLDCPLNAGGWLMIGRIEEPEEAPQKLDLDAMRHGLHLMSVKYPNHFADVMDENDDADTGDVFLQLSLYGEIVFG